MTNLEKIPVWLYSIADLPVNRVQFIRILSGADTQLKTAFNRLYIDAIQISHATYGPIFRVYDPCCLKRSYLIIECERIAYFEKSQTIHFSRIIHTSF